MQGARTTRLPLQLGIQSLYSLAVASATLIPAAIALLATLFVLILQGGFLVVLLFSQGWVVAGAVLVLELVLLIRGVKHLRVALRTRPADVILDDKGLSIVGGRLHGTSVTWAACKSIREHSAKDTDEIVRVSVSIELVDGAEVVVAEAGYDSERASLHALCTSAEAMLHPDALPPLPPEEHPDLLRCPACSAPTAPVDADQTTCAFCSATVPIPTALRDRVHSASEVVADSKVSPALLAKLLAQPSARWASLLSLFAGIPIAAMWILAVVFGFALYRHHGLRAANVLLLSASAMVTILGCYFLLRYWLVNRMALSVITLSFGAFPPTKAGEPWTCRSCRAPLPPARDGLLARCAYCDSDNVQGIDLRPRADGARKERATLEHAFARRQADRKTYATRATLSLAVLPLSLWGFFHGAGALTHEAKLVVACDRGDLDQCVALGRFYLENDYEAANPVFDEACRRGSIDGCGERGYQLTLGGPDELARGVAMLWKSCQTGKPIWCRELGEAIEAHPSNADVPTPLALYRRACDGGEPRGCTLLAFKMATGDGVPKDDVGAVKIYERSCTAKDELACAYLARSYYTGTGVAQDLPRAVAMFEQGCTGDQPNWFACASLGEAYSDGRGVKADREKAFDYTRRACDYGQIVSACTHLGDMQRAGGQLQAALEHYGLACSPSAPDACIGYALVLVDQSAPKKAMASLHAQCFDEHIGKLCVIGGSWLADGTHHVRADADQAMEFFEAGCKLDDSDACTLGGQQADAAEDYATARRMNQRGCELGEPKACNYFGNEQQLGEGAPADEAAAIVTFQRSCELAITNSKPGAQAWGCAHEAMLARKQGDEPRALTLLHKACDWHYQDACDALVAK